MCRMLGIGAVLMLLAILSLGCCGADGSATPAGGESQMARKSIDRVLREHAEEWLSVPGVVGTAVGLSGGRTVIKVLVVRQTPELAARIPSEVDGYPVVIEESGEIRALDED